jgi:hypothetical protein
VKPDLNLILALQERFVVFDALREVFEDFGTLFEVVHAF